MLSFKDFIIMILPFLLLFELPLFLVWVFVGRKNGVPFL